MRVIILASTILLFTASAALADKRPLTDQEKTRLTEVVKTDGCTAGKMKVDDNKFEVDATCADGKKYEFEIDAQFKLIKKEIDD
jgi:Peptidase propeptide and YPEB domain